MNKPQKIILVTSLAVGILAIGVAMLVAHDRAGGSAPVATVPQHPVSMTELAQNDGKNGHKCYVAVSGTVYVIDLDSPNWKNGDHTPSRGLAYCGADLTKVIDQAPHGRQILDTLAKVGSLQG
jgi:predicted heme/steroid binding protein